MKERFAQHANAGPYHYETRFVDGVWEWEISEGPTRASGKATSLEEAKAAIVMRTGRAPDRWEDIGPELK
jgi:hypothetical protein